MKAIVFVVAALAACALADYQLFHPRARPCKYKMYCDEYVDYFMMKDEHTGYIKMVNTTGDYYEIIRCDYHSNESNTDCLYVFDPENKTADGCNQSYISNETSQWDLNVSFYYHFLADDFNYSKNETVLCNYTPSPQQIRANHTPAGNCTMYTNENTGYWIIADAENYILKVYSYFTESDTDKIWAMVYDDDADFGLDVFKSNFCDENKTAMKDPDAVCPGPTPASSSKKPASSSKAPTPTPGSSSKKPASSSKAPTPTPASSSKKPASSFAATLYPAVAVLAAALVALLF